MNHRKILIVLTLILLLAIGAVFLKSKFPGVTEVSTQPSLQTVADPALQDYYNSYEDPFVIQIRTTLNNYINDPKTVSASLVEKGLTMERKTGLSNFSDDYYKGRFVVIDIGNFPGGGKQINILFPDKPDKVFWVWVYKLSEGEGYEMRGFAENPSYTQEIIDSIINQYPHLLNDKAHSI